MRLVLFILAFSACFWSKAQSLPSVTIGGQVWTHSNVAALLPGMSCEESDQYGVLYTWEEAMRLEALLPDWRLPTEKEWRALEEALGSTPADALRPWRQVGAKFKEIFAVRYAGSIEQNTLSGRDTSCTFWTSTTSTAAPGSGGYGTVAMVHTLSTLTGQTDGIFIAVQRIDTGVKYSVLMIKKKKS